MVPTPIRGFRPLSCCILVSAFLAAHSLQASPPVLEVINKTLKPMDIAPPHLQFCNLELTSNGGATVAVKPARQRASILALPPLSALSIRFPEAYLGAGAGGMLGLRPDGEGMQWLPFSFAPTPAAGRVTEGKFARNSNLTLTRVAPWREPVFSVEVAEPAAAAAISSEPAQANLLPRLVPPAAAASAAQPLGAMANRSPQAAANPGVKVAPQATVLLPPVYAHPHLPASRAALTVAATAPDASSRPSAVALSGQVKKRPTKADLLPALPHVRAAAGSRDLQEEKSPHAGSSSTGRAQEPPVLSDKDWLDLGTFFEDNPGIARLLEAPLARQRWEGVLQLEWTGKSAVQVGAALNIRPASLRATRNTWARSGNLATVCSALEALGHPQALAAAARGREPSTGTRRSTRRRPDPSAAQAAAGAPASLASGSSCLGLEPALPMLPNPADERVPGALAEILGLDTGLSGAYAFNENTPLDELPALTDIPASGLTPLEELEAFLRNHPLESDEIDPANPRPEEDYF